jgi:serine/threonine-protein kinase
MSQGVRYRVHRKIARGGMAEIFLASQIGLEGFEKPVVLKRILPALASDPGFLRMLLDEAHIVSGLNHTNLVQVLDLWRADGQFFLVLEFVDGWSLEQVRMRASKARLKLPLHLALSITAALCRALHYVHRHTRNGTSLGIVHRDVNPQNVLLSREGDVKLADFGIAKAVGRREKSAIGVIKGKFSYMSPEQSIGADLDARSDLFSVGSLLYVLTTGHKPFAGKTDLDTLMLVRRARHQKPSAHVRDFNPDVERFIERALRADRSRRWQSAEQMADRLDSILVKLGQPSGPAALKRWLATLAARDGVLSPGDLGERPVEPSTRLAERSVSALDSQPVAVSKGSGDDDEEIATSALRVGEATEVLSEHEFELEIGGSDSDQMNPAATSGSGAEADPAAVPSSDLQAQAPSVDASLSVPPSGEPAAQPTAAIRSAPVLPSTDTPPSELSRPARIALVARIASGLRRTAILALLLSLLVGSGIYLAGPFLPNWIGSATFTKWLDHFSERLPRWLDSGDDHSSQVPVDGLLN